MIKGIWKLLCSVKLTAWILVSGIALLLVGSIYVPSSSMGFNTLNHMRMQDWFREWGLQNLGKTWWFLALTAVLFLLGINTGCCVADRLLFHWKRRRMTGMRIFLYRITPSLIHACFGIMLLGHFASVCIGYRSSPMEFVSRQGEAAQFKLPGGIQMGIGEPECSFYPEPFAGEIRQCGIRLKFTGSEGGSVERNVALGRPLFWNGFQIHMSRVPNKTDPKPFSTPVFQLLIKRDPGLRLILFCFPILILLVLYFYIEEKRLRSSVKA
ncbi:MAG: cytochrome c biogenesis protein ResB [Acidobacteria bacterium]|nr:cytochrome c biogenesis protein ResB [Acidobacteriota bacterium]